MSQPIVDLHIANYADLFGSTPPSQEAVARVYKALLTQGIVGLRGVPRYEEQTRAFISAAIAFSGLPELVKTRYAPLRDSGDSMGYEIGAEQFQDANGVWQSDNLKASYYATVPEAPENKWPKEVNLRAPYMQLLQTMFDTSRKVLNVLGLNSMMGLDLEKFSAWGRMLHYRMKADQNTASNPLWCGAHFDHGVFTALMPSVYVQNGKFIPEPEDAGLYVIPTGASEFSKVPNTDSSVLLFQAGEFGQLASNDRMKATRHMVRKAAGTMERFSFAVFLNAADEARIYPQSTLTSNERFLSGQNQDGSISYQAWNEASLALYRGL